MATLNWIGKEKVINHHLDVPFRTLKHKYTYKDGKRLEDGTKSENKIIHGDNLEALKSLLPEYEGKIKCIYIDPPYNTGNEGWVYNDNVSHPKIKKWLGDVVGKEGEDLTRHDKWLCMMYPRLKLLHKLLSDDGAIFISIDDNEQGHLRMLLDEIFGSGNFISNVIWEKNYSPRNDAKYFSAAHDFILVYSKVSSKWERKLLPRTEKQNKYYKYDDNDGRGLWRPDNILVKTFSKSGVFGIRNPNTDDVFFPPEGNCYRITELKSLELLEENKIYFGKDGKGKPQLKRYLSEVQQGVVPQTLWKYEEVGHNQDGKNEINSIIAGSVFDSPKPSRLIEQILKLGTSPNDIVLDSFAGSGTTAHAVLNLNKQDGGKRKFILVEMEAYAESITAERVKRVIDGYGPSTGSGQSKKVEGTDGDFEYLELGDPLFNEDEYINENQPIEDIRKYVYYSETRTNTGYSDNPRNEYYLGKRTNAAYYFFYEKDKVTTLDLEFASGITIKADQYIMYADKCSLSEKYLSDHNIIFKKIPRDITRI